MKKIYFLILVTIPFLFFWKIWINGLFPIPADALVGLYHPFRDYFANQYPNGVPYKNYLLTDPVLQQYPWKWLVMEQWKHGKVPLENPYNFSGTPLFANPQAGTLYPLNFLFFLGDFRWMWTLYIVLQPILTGLFMFVFLRSLRLTLIACLFGSLVWAFSSFNLVWLEWGNIGHAGLWMPLALFAIEKLRITNYKLRIRKWNLLFLFSLLMSFFAGHPQVFLYVLVATTIYWFFKFGFTKRSFIFFTTYYLLLTTLISPQLIPTLRFTLSSNREAEQQDVLSREGFFIHPKHLVQLLAPDFYGNPSTGNYRGAWNYAEQVIYFGILPLILGLLGVVSRPRKDGPREDGPYKDRPLVAIKWFALFLVAGAIAFSVKNPIAELPYRLQIPIIRDLQPTRLSFLTTFGLSVLAALGLNNLSLNPKRVMKTLLTISGAVGVVLFGLLIIGSKFSPEEKTIAQRNLIFPATLLAGGIGGIWGVRAIGERLRLKTFTILLLTTYYLLLTTVVDLFRFGWKFTPFSPQEYLYPLTPTIRYLQEHMGPDDRYMTLDRRILPPNANVIYGLKSIEGYDPLYAKEYGLVIARMETGQQSDIPPNFGRIVRPMNFRSPIARQLGVRYVLSLSDIEDPSLTKVFQERETRVYELGERGSDTSMSLRI